MAEDAEPSSSSSPGHPQEIEAGVVSRRSRSCRGCLYYSSFLRDNSRNPICVGLSRSEPHVYRIPEKEATKDFKYACIGYGLHKESAPSASDRPVEGTGELPLCVGIEFLADRRPTTQGAQNSTQIPSQSPAHTTTTASECPRRKDADGPPVMPRPPSSVGGGGVSSDEFATRFFRSAGLVASAVVHNVSRVAGVVRTTIDDIFYPDRGRPK